MRGDVVSEVTHLLAPILETETLFLYDVEFIRRSKNSLLRIYIDKEGGINHSHCQEVSKRLSAQLEVEDVIEGSYNLEVSSPGITRNLKKEEHFVKSAGQFAKVTFKKEFAPPQQIVGTLRQLDGKRFKIVPKSGQSPVEFSFDDVARARLEIE